MSRRPTLDELVREAQEDLDPARASRPIDWEKIESALMTRVEREARVRASHEAHRGSRAWIAVGAFVAAAAAVPLLLGKAPSAPLDAAVADAPERAAGALSWKDTRSVVTAKHSDDGTSDVAAGGAIARGDVLDVHGGRAVFERPAPGEVTWSLEDGAKVEVRSVRGPLILALVKGAVEAQVAPVAGGEAFAIDVEGSRVAVHGTHLRVAREGTHVSIDLREGVVSIGVPPKSGSTYGDLVTAPAHVEFDPGDPHGSLKVSHELARVRAASSLDAPPVPLPVASHAAIPVVSAPPRPAAALRPSGSPASPAATPLPAAVNPAAPPVATPAPAPVAPAPAPATPPAARQPDPNAEHTISEAVRTCMRREPPPSDGVVVTVVSRLELRVGDSGMVETARFSPPLAPKVQECASSTIYGTRFTSAGAVTIPLDLSP